VCVREREITYIVLKVSAKNRSQLNNNLMTDMPNFSPRETIQEVILLHPHKNSLVINPSPLWRTWKRFNMIKHVWWKLIEEGIWGHMILHIRCTIHTTWYWIKQWRPKWKLCCISKFRSICGSKHIEKVRVIQPSQELMAFWWE